MIIGCLGPTLSTAERKYFSTVNPWGFILFARNVETPDQLRRLTADLRAAVGRHAPVLIDQEGGRVARMRAPYWTEWPDARAFAAGFDALADRCLAMRLRYRIIGAELRDVGIDVNCAPMADVATTKTHPRIQQRCYAERAGDVAALARAVADGLREAGVLPVLKHIPGHGRSDLDTHEDLPVVDAPRDTLDREDFTPFTELSGLPLGMMAHIVYSALDPDQPASFSPAVVRMVRKTFGFGGLLMSDDLNMHALSGPVDVRAVRVLGAGIDLVLHCNGEMAEMQAIAEVTPLFEAEGLARLTKVEALRAETEAVEVNIEEDLARIDALKNRETHFA